MAMAAMVAVSCNKEGDDNKGTNGGDEPVVEQARLIENFEGEAPMISWNAESGEVFSVVDNPSKTGINTTAKVGKVVSGGQQWGFLWTTTFGGGSYQDSPEEIEFLNWSEEGYIIKVDVYTSVANSPVYLKVESGGAGDPSTYEISNVTTTKVNEWETLEFDYEPAGLADGTYGNFVILFNAGLATEGGEVFYFDNVRVCAE